MNRRDALGTLAGLAVATTAGGRAQSSGSNGMIYREFGRTGEKVSAIGLGGHHIGRPKDPNEGIRIIRSAIDRGITFMDNCWDYHDGESERRMGTALRDGYRQKVFLMTKFDGRTRASTEQQINESLQRLQTDHIDLMQYHENIRLEDPDRFLAPVSSVALPDTGFGIGITRICCSAREICSRVSDAASFFFRSPIWASWSRMSRSSIKHCR